MYRTFSPRIEDRPVYAIADLEALGSVRFLEAVDGMVKAGVRWIQLRAKKASGAQLFHLARDCYQRLQGHSCGLWLDDRVDLAALLPVEGVHLGQQDLPPAAARELLGPQVAIGLSTHSHRQVEEAAENPHVDVVAIGPVFPTVSKLNPEPTVGLQLIREARQLTSKPIVAIGGLSENNLCSVLAAGADSAAFLGAVCHGDVGVRCKSLLRRAKDCP
ncbi:MAG: thiamine phosphate synthase [Deltaproteobacteria bacterium]|nr:thiamine phosphate synthase [Deltaproteobacteria bacterium]